jgi:hypothetical protein
MPTPFPIQIRRHRNERLRAAGLSEPARETTKASHHRVHDTLAVEVHSLWETCMALGDTIDRLERRITRLEARLRGIGR